MQRTLFSRVRSLLCCLLLSCSFINSYASHLVGADLRYTHVSGNTYKIIMAFYGDCGPMSAVAFASLPITTPQICIYSHDTLITNFTLTIDTPTSGVEITPLCGGDSSQCTNPASIRPGVKKFVYSATYTFPYASSAWRLIYGGNNPASPAAPGRAAAITNLTAPASTLMQLTDSLNNMVADNSSPDLTVTQQTFFCVNQHDVYNPMAVDPEGDSLSINLYPADNATGSCTPGGAIAYTGAAAWPGGSPLSATTPLQVAAADSFSMNTHTGDMFFHPAYQRSVVVYNIREFRAGTLVGTSQREMTVLVVSCDTLFPCMYVAASPVSHVGVAAAPGAGGLKIYPNPAGSELNIDMPTGAYSSFTISNSIGSALLQQPIATSQTKISINALAPGMYYITLKGSQGTTVQKFTKM